MCRMWTRNLNVQWPPVQPLWQAVETKFYGDRAGQLRDPFGHMWTLMSHVEDVSHEEIRLGMAKLYGGDVIG